MSDIFVPAASSASVSAASAAVTAVASKPHYVALDGLRGVAALVVLCFHIFEAFATSHLDQRINHGYLAVDFFFVLSGFVVGYAYDGRWGGMTVRQFFRRRLVRLHPMVVMGAVIGVAAFYFGDYAPWNVFGVGLGAMVVAFLLNALLLPAPVGVEVRGLGESFPLNGPSWSLMFEYLANIAYALVIRRLSTRWLTVLVVVAGCGLGSFAIFGPLGDVCAGYSLTGMEFGAGSLRVLFSFSAGLLLCRLFHGAKSLSNNSSAPPTPLGGAERVSKKLGWFWLCSAVVGGLLAMPRIGGAERLWANGIYDTLCCVVAFPLIVWLGARATVGGFTARLCDFLGRLSYPLYLVHYPFIYIYYAWVKNNGLTFAESLPGAAVVVAGSIILAYLCLRFFDAPVRRYLAKRL